MLVEMYRALSPYTESLLRDVISKRLPLQRPLFLHYEDDLATLDVSYQYLYGRDLLVAPVLEPGVDSKQLYLPGPETWVHLFSGKSYLGGNTVVVEAPLGFPPVFYRSGSEFVEVFKEVARIGMKRVNVID